jgi:1-phosphofructokinase family hexose kinase
MLIAGPNLTIDRTSTIPALRPGGVLRLEQVVVTPGGKGLNVARAALVLGAPATLIAFLPGHTGRAVAALIAEEGVALHGVPAAGEVRSTSVVLEEDGRTTVLNEPGPALGDGDWVALEAAVEDALPGHGVLVCSGSLPPGAPEAGYGQLVRRARDAGRRTVVDASGPPLRAALAARPDVVVPNLAEAEWLLHGRADESVEASPDSRPRAEAAAVALVHAGAAAAVVTAAAAGAAVATGDAPAWLPAPAVAVRNPIGAGDVLTAGLATALESGADVLEAARRGVAAAAASVEAPKAGDLDPRRMAALLERVRIAAPA